MIQAKVGNSFQLTHGPLIKSFTDANQFCKTSVNGKLISVRDDEENLLLHSNRYFLFVQKDFFTITDHLFAGRNVLIKEVIVRKFCDFFIEKYLIKKSNCEIFYS